jgi:hypothetical protein
MGKGQKNDHAILIITDREEEEETWLNIKENRVANTRRISRIPVAKATTSAVAGPRTRRRNGSGMHQDSNGNRRPKMPPAADAIVKPGAPFEDHRAGKERLWQPIRGLRTAAAVAAICTAAKVAEGSNRREVVGGVKVEKQAVAIRNPAKAEWSGAKVLLKAMATPSAAVENDHGHR